MSNSNDKRQISPESRVKLLAVTTQSMREVAALVDQVRRSIEMMDQVKKVSFISNERNMGDQIPDEQHYLRRLSEYTIVVGLIHLDINSAIRTYLNGTEPYDTVYATKQLLVTINEGYKQIYHYISTVDGLQVDNKRRQSYWVKDMGRLIMTELPDLLSEYKQITGALDLYDDDELKKMTKRRNLAIHYDKNASEVCDMLIQLDIEILVKKAMSFMAILNDMVRFGLTALSRYSKLIGERTDDFKSFHINKLEKIKTQHPEASDLVSEMQEWLKKFDEY